MPLGYTIGDYALAVVAVALGLAPLGFSLWALLDVAHRPAWAWALADRDRTHWMAAILFTALIVGIGLIVAGYYLVRVRPQIASVEAGRIGE